MLFGTLYVVRMHGSAKSTKIFNHTIASLCLQANTRVRPDLGADEPTIVRHECRGPFLQVCLEEAQSDKQVLQKEVG